MKLAVCLTTLLATLLFAGPAYAGDDQVVISGDLEVPRGKTMDDVVVIDGHVNVRGRLEGELLAISSPVRISGTVEGDVVTITDRAVIERGGRVGGDLVYSDDRPRVAQGAVVEGETRRVDVTEIIDPFRGFAARVALWIAFSVSSLALGMLLMWLAPRALEAASWVARTATGPAIGAGLAAFFGLPAAAVLAIATIVGIPLGVALLLALLPLYAIGYTTSAWLLGRGIVKSPRGRVPAFLAGWGILRLVALIPWVGAFAWFCATVFGLGALTIALWRSRRGAVGPAGTPAAA